RKSRDDGDLQEDELASEVCAFRLFFPALTVCSLVMICMFGEYVLVGRAAVDSRSMLLCI
ncbi:MAG: hypothetical protein PWK00_07500, partial [Coxiella burnetii]|nr:hypothetical protein [Coxiella burnetii]